MKILVEIADGIVQESLKTSHDLEKKFDEYVEEALNELNGKWDERELSMSGRRKFTGVFAEDVVAGELIHKKGEEAVCVVANIYRKHGKVTGLAVKDKLDVRHAVYAKDFPKYEILPF